MTGCYIFPVGEHSYTWRWSETSASLSNPKYSTGWCWVPISCQLDLVDQPTSAEKNWFVCIMFSSSDNMIYNWSNFSRKCMNWYFLQKKGVNQIKLRHKIGTQLDKNSQKWGSSLWNLPTIPKYGSTPPPLDIINCKLALLQWCLHEFYNKIMI